MGNRPGVTIGLLNGGLALQGPTGFGDCVVLVASPVAPVAGYGVPFACNSPAAVQTAFAQEGNAAVVTAFTDGFFAEAPSGTNVYILAMARTTTLATMLAAANANLALNLAVDINGIPGTARMLAVIKFPDLTSYTPTIANGFDNDVAAAVTAAQTLAATWLAKNHPLRIFVEGFAFTDTADAEDYSTASNRNVAICLGNIDGQTSTATLLALGAAAGIVPQQNIGRIKNGSLNIPATSVVNIGSILADDMTDADLNTLWTKRYITFERNKIASGYVFNDDNMLTQVTDDYNNLRYGRIADNAVRVIFNTYYEELKDNVDVDDTTGQISTVAQKALEADITTAIGQQMPGQLNTKSDGTPDVTVLVNPDPTAYSALYIANNITTPVNFNILQTNAVYIFVLMKPQGCLKYINVYVGFTNS